MHEKREKTRSYQWRKNHSSPKISWVWGLERENVFGKWRDIKLSREIEENETWNRVGSIYRKCALMDRELSRICRVLILDRWICRGDVENLSTAKCLDGLRSYQESIGQTETSSMDWESVEKLLRKILENFDGSKMR